MLVALQFIRFWLTPRPLDSATVKSILLTVQSKFLLLELDLLVIDEASMLRADVLDAIDYLLKDVMQDIRLLGGLQVAFYREFISIASNRNQTGC